jgi:hypothetical protein
MPPDPGPEDPPKTLLGLKYGFIVSTNHLAVTCLHSIKFKIIVLYGYKTIRKEEDTLLEYNWQECLEITSMR